MDAPDSRTRGTRDADDSRNRGDDRARANDRSNNRGNDRSRGHDRDRARGYGANRGRDNGVDVGGPRRDDRRPRRDDRRPRRDEPEVVKLAQKSFLRFPVPPPDAEPSELLPPPMEAAPRDPGVRGEFEDIAAAVAKAKTQLDGIPAKEFDGFMRAVDLYHGLKRQLREDANMQIATNASIKMYELIMQMRLMVCQDGPLPRVRAFCDAELPGAFIVAINHYVKTMCPETNLDWVASSYYPEAAVASGDPTILGDHYGIYAGNRERWLMGPRPNGLPDDMPAVTGDLTDPDVVEALADAVHARFGGASTGASLYTSDAGIDVSGDFNRQEELTSLLNYGQVLCGLLALAPGGHLVTKQYTFLCPFSRSLIGLVAALFDETYVTKPLTSRPVNSEVYLVAKGFRGLDPALRAALLGRLAAYRAAAAKPAHKDWTPCDWAPLIDPSLIGGVDAALLRAARQIHGRQQVAFLDEAAVLHARFRGRADLLARALFRDARSRQEAWLSTNPVRRIRGDALLVTTPPDEKRGGGARARPDGSEDDDRPADDGGADAPEPGFGAV